MKVCFHNKLNVIIGSNASNKTTMIDAIRLFYGWGDPNNDLEITKDDFYRKIVKGDVENEVEEQSTVIRIEYEFSELSNQQKGAYYHYLVIENGETTARVVIEYTLNENGRIYHSYNTGKEEANQRADYETFQLFKAYHLGALRDSTRSLMSTKNNLLGQVIKRKVERNDSEDSILQIIKDANNDLLEQKEVIETKTSINENLAKIHHINPQQVELQISQNSVEYIVNVIKPFIPISQRTDINGYTIWNNSLGYNNLIYIATVLSDIKESHQDDENSICALLIEEPEAHLHPQLQINLYNFLKSADTNNNAQTFITTHSPTLTSRIPFENIILLKDDKSYCIGDCFKNRAEEKIMIDTNEKSYLSGKNAGEYKQMLVRYLDVTRSQLLFAKGAIFVEGISEALLLNTFSKLQKKQLTDNEIELVNIDGTAFGQFLMLFNSSNPNKRLPIKSAFITDGDQFTDSKKVDYDLDKLIVNNYSLLETLRNNIQSGTSCRRVENMISMGNGQKNIHVSTGEKTFEFQIALANMKDKKETLHKNCLYKFLNANYSSKVAEVDLYIDSLENDTMSSDEQYNAALLMWKSMPGKSKFAQSLSEYLEEKIEKEEIIDFEIPQYIKETIDFIIG